MRRYIIDVLDNKLRFIIEVNQVALTYECDDVFYTKLNGIEIGSHLSSLNHRSYDEKGVFKKLFTEVEKW